MQVAIVALLVIGYVIWRSVQGDEMDSRRVETALEHWTAKQSPNASGITADCPDHIEVDPGREFHCIVTDDTGDSIRITVTIENDDGDVTWAVG